MGLKYWLMEVSMKKMILVAALSLSASAASAGLLIEPYLGLESGQNVAVSNTADLSSKTSGTVAGLRLAYSLPVLFWFGADYSMVASGNAKPDFSSNNYNYTRSDLYAVAGVDLPVLLRFWVGYGLANSMVQKKAAGDETYSAGTNLKAGVGIKLIPFFNIFVEAYSHKSSTVPANITGSYGDAGYVAGLSFPIDL